MSEPWMDHPKLVAWFDDIEDAVTAAFALTDEQRREVRALKAPRRDTWVMLATDEQARDVLRDRMRLAALVREVPVAADCSVLQDREFGLEQDTFEQDNGFEAIEDDYVEEGSAEALRRELLSDADDYASSEESGWFYTNMDDEQDRNNDDLFGRGLAFVPRYRGITQRANASQNLHPLFLNHLDPSRYMARSVLDAPRY